MDMCVHVTELRYTYPPSLTLFSPILPHDCMHPCQTAVVALQAICVSLLYYRQKLFDIRPQFVCPVEIPPNTVAVSYVVS
ncbi:hypothetical protein J6590_000231 [Homalodisca vitripennis]|nr:hypothetical protein J6590_000231 [Homalodisca vitripennis]